MVECLVPIRPVALLLKLIYERQRFERAAESKGGKVEHDEEDPE